MNKYNLTYTFKDFQLAYRKLKSYVYYDTSNTNLFLRQNLAQWESNGLESSDKIKDRIDNKIKVLCEAYPLYKICYTEIKIIDPDIEELISKTEYDKIDLKSYD